MKTNKSKTAGLAAGQHVGPGGIKSPAVLGAPRMGLQAMVLNRAVAGKGAQEEQVPSEN